MEEDKRYYIFIRTNECGIKISKPTENIDDFLSFSHYNKLLTSDDWEWNKRRFEESCNGVWCFEGNDVYYYILSHPSWEDIGNIFLEVDD